MRWTTMGRSNAVLATFSLVSWIGCMGGNPDSGEVALAERESALTSAPDAALTSLFDRARAVHPDEPDEWIGGDSAASVKLPDGRVAWTFGDTFIGKVDANHNMVPGYKMIDNSIVLTKPGTDMFVTLTGPNKTALVPSPAGSLTWLYSGKIDADRLRIFGGVFSGGSFTGSVIASFTNLSGTPTLENVFPAPGSSSGINWGSAILDAPNGYTFIYGKGMFDGAAYLARVKTEHTLFGPWKYFDGAGWNDDKSQARKIHDYAFQSIRVLPSGLFAATWGLGDRIHQVYSAYTFGPYSGDTIIYDPPEAPGVAPEERHAYFQRAHPAYDLSATVQMYGYSINRRPGTGMGLPTTNYYRPRFFTVTR
jgi:hypothetical protein